MLKTCGGILILLAWYSIVGHARVNDWRGELSLWTRAVAVQPSNPRVHLNRAKAFYGVGREDDAIRELSITDTLESH